jgi:Uma2 family endonuclease
MAIAPQRKPPRLSVELFRALYDTRPDEEHWQLIDGAAVMMTPTTVAHQIIATNLQTLLSQALRRHAPTLTALQALGVNIAPPVEDYDPEPDVIVIDASVGREIGRRYVDRFYLAAEIVSASDRTWVEKKREIYKLHEACICILTIQQDRLEARVEQRANDTWSDQLLKKPDDPLVLTDFGLHCNLADLYQGTALELPEVPTH